MITNFANIVERTEWGMTRNEVIARIGHPDDVNIGTREHPLPTIFKYGAIELYFDCQQGDGLYMIYQESEDHSSVVECLIRYHSTIKPIKHD